MGFSSKVRNLIITVAGAVKRSHRSRVIYYHDLGTDYTEMGTPVALFQKHIHILKNLGFSIVSDITKDTGQLMICFDDGWRGLYDHRDVLKDFSPKVFLANSLIGSPGHLTKEQILELQELGFRFEGHTWSHTNVTQFSETELKRELLTSREELSSLLRKEVTELCFPQGYFNDHVINEAFLAGYTALYVSYPGSYAEPITPRCLVQDLEPAAFRGIILGGRGLPTQPLL